MRRSRNRDTVGNRVNRNSQDTEFPRGSISRRAIIFAVVAVNLRINRQLQRSPGIKAEIEGGPNTESGEKGRGQEQEEAEAA